MQIPNIPPLVLAGLAVFGLWMSAVRGASRKKEALSRSGLLPEPGHGTDDDVRRLIEAREVVEAIKLYRDIHGVGLKEAKEAVERMRSPS
jgi:ribosomal protein L7/L12